MSARPITRARTAGIEAARSPAGNTRTFLAVVALSLLMLALPRSTNAQGLDQIESLLLRGRLTDARNALSLWKEQNPRAAAAQQAHALLLTGQLATDVTSAMDAYLALALTYPTSLHASTALLRLGQGLTATGEAERARGYLERLVRDYPNMPDRAAAMLWLARAQRATGRDAAACTTLREAGSLQTTAETSALIEADVSRACTS